MRDPTTPERELLKVRDRARVLRDTVRAARARMATVVTTSTEQTLAADLDDVAAQIELALPNAEQPSLN